MPVPWSTASTSRVGNSCDGEPPGGEIMSSSPIGTVDILPGADFDVTAGGFRVQGRIVSEINGNEWRFGLENSSVTPLDLPDPGELLPTNSSLSVSIGLNSSATIVAPDDGSSLATQVLFRGGLLVSSVHLSASTLRPRRLDDASRRNIRRRRSGTRSTSSSRDPPFLSSPTSVITS